jgi:hypothetical protein
MRLHFVRRVLPFLVLSAVAALPAPSSAQVAVGVSVTLAPPPIPIYAEPPLPGDGYIFTPGYWAWGPSEYYWVPGTWVLPPAPGLLWTPGYWGFVNGAYLWHAGYWGPHVGFYGGVNYGFGYSGIGYIGGRWDGGHFFYNSAIHNFGHVHVAGSFREAPPAFRGARPSFSGGPHGARGEPGRDAGFAAHEEHRPPSDQQLRHERVAGGLHHAVATVNHGRPYVAATAHAGTFNGRGVVSARHAGPPVHAAHAVPPGGGHGGGGPHGDGGGGHGGGGPHGGGGHGEGGGGRHEH